MTANTTTSTLNSYIADIWKRKWDIQYMLYIGWPKEALDTFTKWRIFWLMHND